MARYNQGFFKPDHPEKYKGDPTNIVYRSGWEFKVMSDLDKALNVIEWSSEEVVIPYRSPIDNRVHRYYLDFYMKVKNKETGVIEHYLIEVKPKKETVPPKVQSNKKPSKRYLNEVKNWGVNSAKWKAAEEYCKSRGWKFIVMNEDHIFA